MKRPKQTTDSKLSALLELVRIRNNYSRQDMAAVGRTSERTALRDVNNPLDMTMGRFLGYMKPELSENEIIAALERLIAEKEIAS